MSIDVPPGSLDLESQLLSIMDVLVKAAVTEISQLFSTSSASLRVQLSQSLKENETLRMRMKGMRSELFTLKLQTRTNRPASRFSQMKGNLAKPRIKPLAVLRPPTAQETVEDDVSMSPQLERRTSAHTQCTDVEGPDVILIKDEDDIGECEPSKGQENLEHSARSGTTGNLQPSSSSCLTQSDMELRIVSVHGRGEGPLHQENSLFNISQLQAFSSLSPDQSQLDGDSSTQITSTVSNPALKPAVRGADCRTGQLSHVSQLPQQQNTSSQAPNKPLDCSFCGKRFLKREDLIAHRAKHTGELPVCCSFCGKSFYNKATLNIHMRIHTGEKPFACTQCGKRFTQKGSLKIHLRIHSGEKPYICSQCTASFNNPSNLRRHMITHNMNGVL
ncbi:uncharacterized protein LOC141793052 isoform X2 [Halichoeres trimaculatus]|uniref:uncharacterized protein LOC141793052 isoform X2 n=1 Tax=Halichoeres trimaculatus TaxID=147232 RepID=UPI003D9F2CED